MIETQGMIYRKKYIQMATIAAISLLLMMICAGLMMVAISTRPKPEKGAIIHEYHECMDTLSQWQLFEMALVEVESNYNSNAVSNRDGRGILQLTPIYVEEVNRIIGTEYQENDAYNDTISLICFTAVNNHRNEGRDIDKAIKIHNPNAGAWYHRRVNNKMKEIQRREQVRKLIINQ